MAFLELKTHNYQDIVNDVMTRFYPRDLILDEPQILNCFQQALMKLDDYCYNPRYYELAISGNKYVDTTTVAIDGVTVKKVIKVYSTTWLDTIFTVYSQIIGQTPFHYNLVRNQDTFIEFTLTQQVMNQINKKYRNKDTGFMLMPDGKLLLDPSAFNYDTTVMIAFYPHFKWKIEEAQKWELYSTEYAFLTNYLEYLVMYREGRSMSESSFTELTTNAELYMTQGQEGMTRVLDEFKGGGLIKSGKRF